MVLALVTDQASTPAPDAADLERVFAEKARAELGAADRIAPGSDGVRWSGDLFAEVVLVKGEPGPAEVSGGPALSGPDGTAASKALEALGFGPQSWFATVVRPEAGIDAVLLRERLVMQVETVDPTVVVALDPTAAAEVAAAFGLENFGYGTPLYANGRSFVALEGLEASLADARLKRRVWRQMQAIQVRPPAL